MSATQQRPCEAMPPALRIREVIQPGWRGVQQVALRDIGRGNGTTHTALSYFLLTSLRDLPKHSTLFFMNSLYYEDQIDSNKVCTCFTDTKLDKFPVQSQLKEHISQRLKI